MDGTERTLGLPETAAILCDEAAAALQAEHQRTTVWRALPYREATVTRGNIWRLRVSDLSSVSWTWEGASALAPRDLSSPCASDPDASWWRGVVVEVDEVQGYLYVDLAPGGETPSVGTVVVRPFDFLASLHRLFTDESFSALRAPLAAGLAAAAGRTSGATCPPEGLPRLSRATERTWGILWGPPGTGKTWMVGRQVAALWPQARVLVVSTTNKATDGVALSIARAIRTHTPGASLAPRLVRVGSGADLDRFVPDRLTGLLAGGEVGLRRRLADLQQQRSRTPDRAARAALTAAIQQTRRSLDGCSKAAFLADECRVVVTTAFNALRQLTDPDLLAVLEGGRAPFDLVVVDEAGLVCRAATAALSLLAARRVLLVGDPRQLAPIAEQGRLLPWGQTRWLGESALGHLDSATQQPPGVCLLRVQHRMHPEIRAVISAYQYDGRLADGASVPTGPSPDGMPRAGWLVLDDWVSDRVDVRADRGTGGKSWVRRCTPAVLDAILEASPRLAGASVMFVTPFAGQARTIRAWALERGQMTWSASTVHSQQGAEADHVIFDTVNAGLAAWPPAEWQRLINVGLSRARESVLLLASRAEMDAPWLRPLQDLLTPCGLRPGYGGLCWRRLEPVVAVALPGRSASAEGADLGARIAALQAVRPVLSADQQRLCEAPLDGSPRLVRGVAGSGKTLVLAHWLVRILATSPHTQPLWVVYGNSALQRVLVDQILGAWQQRCPGQALPWGRLALWHIRDLLRTLLPEAGLRLAPDNFDHDTLCQAWLARVPCPLPRCAVLFLDEAQDFGPQTLRLLFSLVVPPDPAQPRVRPVMIFYDHDQNIYGRPLPDWSTLGLDVQGRTAVLREAYRSTRPIMAVALNVLHRLHPPAGDAEHRQRLRRGLLQPSTRQGERWWDVNLTEIDGPTPTLALFPDRDAEVAGITRQVLSWVVQDGIAPGDVRILSHAPDVREAVAASLDGALRGMGGAVTHQAGRTLPTDARTLLVTTPHSYKGHDAEVVLIAGLDRFASRRGPLSQALYVSMTRARSILAFTGLAAAETPGGQQVLRVVSAVLAAQHAPPEVLLPAPAPPPQAELLRRVGPRHLGWIATLWAQQRLHLTPLPDLPDLPTPLFWLARTRDGSRFACFAEADAPDLEALAAAGVTCLRLGAALPP